MQVQGTSRIMIHRYHIHHEKKPLAVTSFAPETPLSEEALGSAYRRFGARVEQYFRSLPELFIGARTIATANEGIDVWLDSHLDQATVENLVTSLVRDMNLETAGLHLLTTLGSVPTTSDQKELLWHWPGLR